MHTHLWLWDEWTSDHPFCECGENMPIDEMVRRLNAVEMLEKAIRNALDEMGDNREVILEQALAERLRGAS